MGNYSKKNRADMTSRVEKSMGEKTGEYLRR